MLTLLNTFFGPKHNVVMDGDGESAKGIGAIYFYTTPISQQYDAGIKVVLMVLTIEAFYMIPTPSLA